MASPEGLQQGEDYPSRLLAFRDRHLPGPSRRRPNPIKKRS